MKTKALLLLLLPALVASCGSATDEDTITYQTYRINSYRVPCNDWFGPTECLQVQKEGSEDWQLLYVNIEGFQFEPGYLYRIRVREEKLDPAQLPADYPSSIKRTLVSVEEKIPDPRLPINEIWVLRAIEGLEVTEEQLAGQLKRPNIEFHLRDKRYLGTDGCNTFRGSIESLTGTGLRLGPAMRTRMTCLDTSIPDAYLKLLDRVDSYQLQELELILSEGNAELLRFRKTE